MSDVDDLITEHIDTWTSAIKINSTAGRGTNKKRELYGLKKLRELILELAVRGLLTNRIANDEPVERVLLNILLNKKALIKENKLKKQKNLPPITDEDKPYSLPTNWVWSRLGELTNYGILEKAEAQNAKPETWILELEDVEKETSKLLQKKRFAEREFKSSKNVFEIGDVIYGKLRPYLDKVLVADEPGVCTTEMIPVRAFADIIPEYLRIIMKSPTFKEYANNSTHGMNLPRMGTDKARLALIPICSVKEQQCIVAKVHELLAFCDQIELKKDASIDAHGTLVSTLLKSLTLSAENSENGSEQFQQAWERIAENFDVLFTTESSIEQLKQTILQLAVMGKLVPQDPRDESASILLEKIAEEKEQLIKDKEIKKQKLLPAISEDEKPFELPHGWEFQRIGTFGIVGTGGTPSRTNPAYWSPPEINWVSSGETSELYISETKEKVSQLAVKETNVSIYPAGTLIVAMYGQGKTRGQITELLEEAGTNQACAAIQLVNKMTHHKDYVKLYFRKSYAELRSHAAGGAQPNLNVGKIANTLLAIPPLAEQERIVAKTEEFLSVCDALKERLICVQSIQLDIADAITYQSLN
jgi:type I restriction enzyme S subunit